ncbi:NAD(P)/FAD-dependent oxidoreductase [Dechloromonas sp.]|uniref:NAD(P)/FAD-dependent oxidoreductase n=1 Tax=Dechloromonas sp. TaxID=1917218 RepID=UPI0012210B0B|nr:FAD-dependent oxidoreductase [Dechloromonas sp.]MBU3697220.1 FAD-dependent oxidoreductase [Dechloromonas sp.]TEX48605.1 MAG: NAD/FAD-binding protein [Rhodocyclaceae bacterium]
MNKKQRIAVVGAGISGLASAWLLSREHEVTLFEAGSHLGGHTNTVDVTLDGKTHPVDTGFLVFNERTYPNLIAMFALLGVESVETEMSFAVSLENPDLEWAGSNLATVFGQKRNLVRRSFWSMLSDILRFNRESVAWLASHPDNQRSLRDFLREGRYSDAFADWYLLPMAAAIWSCPTGQMLDTPLSTFVRFCQNHGLLQIFDRPSWRTVQGGGREYVKKIAALLDDIRLACPVHSVRREADGLRVTHAAGSEMFDQVVMACHSDQSLAILGNAASDGQRGVLASVRYQPNRALLHTDRALLPRDEKLWSAWNYFAGSGEPGHQPVGVSYLINKLQPLPFKTPVVVTLNPAREPDPAKVIAEFDYAHPIFDGPAIAAQQRLASVQGENGIWLAGAWGSYGFHEDGLKSALRVVNGLGVVAPWQGAPALAQVAETA